MSPVHSGVIDIIVILQYIFEKWVIEGLGLQSERYGEVE